MQTFLDTFRRPVVPFDVNNKEHRMHMAIFLKYGSWAKCPYAFYSPQDISVKAFATEALAEFYLKQEFPLRDSDKFGNVKVTFNEIIED